MGRNDQLRISANPVQDLYDAAAQHYDLKLSCRGCRRVRVLHAAAVWWHFRRKGFAERLRDVPAKFRCRVCERRGPRLELVHAPVTDTSLPLPPEIEWKHEQRRRR